MKSMGSSKTAKMLFPLVLTAVTWLYPATEATASTNAQMIRSTGAVVARTNESKVPAPKFILNENAKRWIQFQDLRKEWLAKRSVSSSISEMSMLDPYLKIIALGEAVVPLILSQLKAEGDEPDQWFWALRIITDANPVRAEDQGDFRAMAKAWIEWGRTRESSEYAG